MKITWTLLNYYIICKRKLRLSYNNMWLEHTSEKVKIGKKLHQNRYNKNKTNNEVSFDCMKIDKINEQNIEEYKKTNVHVESAKLQCLFYLWKLEQKGIKKDYALLKFEENRDNKKIYLTEEKRKYLKNQIRKIKKILKKDNPPWRLSLNWKPAKKCEWCSYHNFCWI